MLYLLLFLLMFDTPIQAQSRDFTSYGPLLTADYQFDMSAFLPADRLRLQDLKNEVPALSSYEDFLEFLAERRPALYENSVLIHDTGSLQYADLEHPRTILFGDGLMLAFAEDPRRAERTVEVIAFERNQFQFAELKFGSDGVSFQENPSQCQSCHGTTPKPLWDPYDFWPNAYGSAIARFGTVAEKGAYEKIRTQNAKMGIYNRLKWTVPPSNNNRGLPGIEAFTQYVNQLQTFATLPRWQKQAAFTPMIPVLLAITNECATDANDQNAAAKLAAYVPEAWRHRVQTEFPAWHQKVQTERRRLKDYQSARYKLLFPNSSGLFKIDHERLADETQTTAQLFFMLELAGIDARDFTLSQGPNPYFMTVPSNRDADFATDLALVSLDLFRKLNPTLSNSSSEGYNWARFRCQDLKQESLSQLANQPMASTPQRDPRLAPTVFGECMSCHSGIAKPGIPAIPFDQTSGLRKFLQTDDNAGLQKVLERIQKKGPGQMPPYRQLNAEEQEQLRLNLQRIAD